MRFAVPAMMVVPIPPSFVAMPAMMGAIFTMMMVMPAVMMVITRLGIGSR